MRNQNSYGPLLPGRGTVATVLLLTFLAPAAPAPGRADPPGIIAVAALPSQLNERETASGQPNFAPVIGDGAVGRLR